MHLSAFRVLNFWKFCSKFAVGFFRDADLLGMGDGGDGGLSSLHAQDSEGEQAALFLGKCKFKFRIYFDICKASVARIRPETQALQMLQLPLGSKRYHSK